MTMAPASGRALAAFDRSRTTNTMADGSTRPSGPCGAILPWGERRRPVPSLTPSTSLPLILFLSLSRESQLFSSALILHRSR